MHTCTYIYMCTHIYTYINAKAVSATLCAAGAAAAVSSSYSNAPRGSSGREDQMVASSLKDIGPTQQTLAQYGSFTSPDFAWLVGF